MTPAAIAPPAPGAPSIAAPMTEGMQFGTKPAKGRPISAERAEQLRRLEAYHAHHAQLEAERAKGDAGPESAGPEDPPRADRHEARSRFGEFQSAEDAAPNLNQRLQAYEPPPPPDLDDPHKVMAGHDPSMSPWRQSRRPKKAPRGLALAGSNQQRGRAAS